MSEPQKSEKSVTIDQLGNRRQPIIETIRALDGTANTAQIRQRTDVPEGSIGYHLGRLEEWGLIVEVGRESVRGGDDAIVWGLTDGGEELLERIDEQAGRGYPQTFDALHERIDELEDELEQVQEHDELLETVKERFNKMADIVRKHEERLESLESAELAESPE